MKLLKPITLQSDILDVNEIFKELGTMVYEQGDMIGMYININY